MVDGHAARLLTRAALTAPARQPVRSIYESSRSEILEEKDMPRIKMTPTVRFALYFLRIYLIALFGLLVFRFFQVIR
jgi:hypothetical protein